jgi:hypothetical protein
MTSVAVKIFSHLISFIKKFCKCTYNAIFKDNAAINCVTVHHKSGSIRSAFTGHTILVSQ